MVIFHKPNAIFEYSDKALWNMILYQMEDGDELEEEKEEEFNKEGEVEEPWMIHYLIIPEMTELSYKYLMFDQKLQ